jgi:hypothetical protein
MLWLPVDAVARTPLVAGRGQGGTGVCAGVAMQVYRFRKHLE